MKILIMHEHHGNVYFDISTREKFDAACLAIVNRRHVDQSSPLYYGPDDDDEDEEIVPPQISRAKAEALADVDARDLVLNKWNRYEADIENRKNEKAFFAMAKKAVQDGDGLLAFKLMNKNRYSEDEGFEIVETMDPANY